MKSLKVSNWTKKVLAGMLPVLFLFVTMFSGNVSYAAAPTTVKVPNETDGVETTIVDKGTRDYNGKLSDSKGTAKASKGTISYSTNSEKGVLILDGVDITTDGALIDARGGEGYLEIVLKGTNVVTSSNDTTVLYKDCHLKFIGDGTLTIKQETTGIAMGSSTDSKNDSLEFAQEGVITINQFVDVGSLVLSNLILTKGTINVNQIGRADSFFTTDKLTITGGEGTLNIVQNVVKDIDGDPVYALYSEGDITIAGGNVNVTLTDADAEGSPIYSEGNITISNANVKAIGGANKKSPYGIETKAGAVTTINKGSTVEMFGKEAANFEQVAIDDTVTWEVMAGNTAETAVKLEETKAADILAKLKANKYSYVKINEPAAPDKLPKTGNTGAVMPYVLLLVAGVFTVIIANKKKAF